MNSVKLKKKSVKQKRKGGVESNKKLTKTRLLIIVLLIIAIIILVLAKGRILKNDDEESGTTRTSDKSDYSMLVGRWVRPDGGYILKIYSVGPDGRVKAGYYNPNPIHVGEAFVAIEKEKIRLFIKLQDKGYPGSTYNLIYSPANDSFFGIYYQAAMGQSFEVAFVRNR